jgi:hypothetical protein
MTRFVRGDRLWSLTLLNAVRLTQVRYAVTESDRHWGIHRHRDGGELVMAGGPHGALLDLARRPRPN